MTMSDAPILLPFAYRARVVPQGKRKAVESSFVASVPVVVGAVLATDAPLVVEADVLYRKTATGFLRPVVHPSCPEGVSPKMMGRLAASAETGAQWEDYPLWNCEGLPDFPFGTAMREMPDGAVAASSERSVREGHARVAAAGLCVINGAVWRATAEPCLSLAAERRGMFGYLKLRIVPGVSSDDDSACFRCDRLPHAYALGLRLAEEFNKVDPKMPHLVVHRPDLLEFDEAAMMADRIAAFMARKGFANGALPTQEVKAAWTRFLNIVGHHGVDADPAPLLEAAADLMGSGRRNLTVGAMRDAWFVVLKEQLSEWRASRGDAAGLSAEDEAALDLLSRAQ